MGQERQVKEGAGLEEGPSPGLKVRFRWATGAARGADAAKRLFPGEESGSRNFLNRSEGLGSGAWGTPSSMQPRFIEHVNQTCFWSLKAQW